MQKIREFLESEKCTQKAYEMREYFRNLQDKATKNEAACASIFAILAKQWDELYKHLIEVDYIKNKLDRQ